MVGLPETALPFVMSIPTPSAIVLPPSKLPFESAYTIPFVAPDCWIAPAIKSAFAYPPFVGSTVVAELKS